MEGKRSVVRFRGELVYGVCTVFEVGAGTASSRGPCGVFRVMECCVVTQRGRRHAPPVLSVRHEYEYCDVCVNRSDDNMLDDCFQASQRLNSDPTTTPQQCHQEIDNAADRTDQ